MIIKHCLTCGELLDQLDDTCYQCPLGHQFFNNPHSGASVVFLRDDGYVLVTQRAIEPNKGKYGLIGGFLQFGEAPEDGARREAKEEAGVDVDELELLGVYPNIYRPNESVTSIIFLAKHWHGEFRAGDDAARLVWKPLDIIISHQFGWPQPKLLQQLQSRR